MTDSDADSLSDTIWPDFARSQSKPIRLVLIDDHPVVREGICALLSLEGDLNIVGDTGDIDAGIELVRVNQPDLVICDLTMPGCTGVLAVRKLCSAVPTARVLVLTANDALECIRESFSAGAVGYVRKDSLRVDLLAAVRRAAGGEHAICRGVSDLVMRNWMIESRSLPGLSAPLDPEDRQIVRLIALGVPTRRIASDLGRGVKGMEKHRANLMRRLDLNNAAAVTRFAVRCNIVSNEEVDQLFPAD